MSNEVDKINGHHLFYFKPNTIKNYHRIYLSKYYRLKY